MLARIGARRQSALDQPPACPHFVKRATSWRREPMALPIRISLSS